MLLMVSNCSAFKVYFFDWQFVYFNSPDFLAACDAGIMDKDIGLSITKKIDDAKLAVQNNKGDEVVIVPLLDDLEDLNPLLDVTSEVYDELCKGE